MDAPQLLSIMWGEAQDSSGYNLQRTILSFHISPQENSTWWQICCCFFGFLYELSATAFANHLKKINALQYQLSFYKFWFHLVSLEGGIQNYCKNLSTYVNVKAVHLYFSSTGIYKTLILMSCFTKNSLEYFLMFYKKLKIL